MVDKINVPLSMCKKFLAQNGCRVTPEATKKFEEKLRNWASEVSLTASNKVTEAKRKTIDADDLD